MWRLNFLANELDQHSAQMIYEEQLIKKFKANPKALYAYVKAKQKVKDTSYQPDDGSMIENNRDIVLGQLFQATFSEEAHARIP